MTEQVALYDKSNAKSILSYAERLKGRTLRECILAERSPIYGKGSFGQILQKYYFLIELDSESVPDFRNAGIELKSAPVYRLKNGKLVPKERIVLSMIDFVKICGETWETSSLMKKSAKLLLVFYLYEEGKIDADFKILIVKEWKFPESDLKIIRDDWEKIVTKIKHGEAHLISEGDTLYLGACRKGSGHELPVRQPFSPILAPKRAFSLKTAYVRNIIAPDIQAEAISLKSYQDERFTFEANVLNRFKHYYGKDVDEITAALGAPKISLSKDSYARVARLILGVRGRRIEEFQKADICMKTVRLEESGIPKESMSFPAFKYLEMMEEADWSESELYEQLTRRFFITVFQRRGKRFILVKCLFWTMPVKDLNRCQQVWMKTVELIRAGKYGELPSMKGHDIIHVRPHGTKGETYPTAQGRFKKQSFWLHRKYIGQQVK